jgi:hypothetical protein
VFPDVIEKGVLKARYSFGGHVFSVFVEGQFGLPAYRIRIRVLFQSMCVRLIIFSPERLLRSGCR